MFSVLFTLFCITASGLSVDSVPPPVSQSTSQPVCWTQQRPDWAYITKKGKSPNGWCDRILYLTKGNIDTKIQPSDYNAVGNWAIDESDHDLVVAYYSILKTGDLWKSGPKKGTRKEKTLFNVLSVTFNIGDKKKNDKIKERFNAIICSLKAKYGVEKWGKIDIFHFAFQEAKAWWAKKTKDWKGNVKTEAKPKFDFGTTLKTAVTGTWKDKYKYQGEQGALLYVYYNTAKITYQQTIASVDEHSFGHFIDANQLAIQPGHYTDKSFTMLGYFYATPVETKPKTKPQQQPKKPEEKHFIVFATAHFPKQGNDERIAALTQIKDKFSNYNVNEKNVILILGADTNFRAVNEKDTLKGFLKTMAWKEIADATFKPTCKRQDKVKFYESIPDCKSKKTPKTSKCWSECTSLQAAQLYTVCTKAYKRPAAQPQKTTKAGKCANNKVRVLCDKKIPTCNKKPSAAECLSKVAETSKIGTSTCQIDGRSLKTQVAYKWIKGDTRGTRSGSKKCCYRFLCGKKTEPLGDITPWNDNNYIYNPSTSSSYYMYFMTMAILLMIIILCGIFGLCVGSICFVGAYYYGQQSVKKMNQMDEKYP